MIIGQKLSAQSNYKEYFQWIYKAYESTDNNIRKSCYSKAFTYAEPLAAQVIDYAIFCFSTNDTIETNLALKKAVELVWWFDYEQTSCDTFLTIVQHPEITNISAYPVDFGKHMLGYYGSNYKPLREQFLSKAIRNDPFEALLVNEMSFQNIRMNIYNKRIFTDIDSKQLESQLSRPNTELLIKLMRCNIFPNPRTSAHFTNWSFTIVLTHALSVIKDQNELEDFYNLLWKQVELGYITPFDWANSYEFYMYFQKKKKSSKFGQQAENSEIVPLDNPESIDILRESRWLPTLEKYCQMTGNILPKNYKKQ